MSSQGDAYTSIAVLPDANTVLRVRVQATAKDTVLASVHIGDGRHVTTVTVGDEDTLNRLVAVFGEARARFAGAQTRLREPEAPVSTC